MNEPILRGGSVITASWPDCVMLGDSNFGSAAVSDKHSCCSTGRPGDGTDLLPGNGGIMVGGTGANLLWLTLSGLCITLALTTAAGTVRQQALIRKCKLMSSRHVNPVFVRLVVMVNMDTSSNSVGVS